jgi:hypothetical protein
MKPRGRIFVLAILVVPLIVVGIGFHPQDVLAALPSNIAPAGADAPDCARPDPVCMAWTEFRRARPYPYQAFATMPLADGSLVLIISEPAPVLAKADLEKLIRAAFGSDLLALKRPHWQIGIDGWVADLVLKIRGLSPSTPDRDQETPRDPLDDPLLRDRIALLHLALFGTTYGGHLEPIPRRICASRRRSCKTG